MRKVTLSMVLLSSVTLMNSEARSMQRRALNVLTPHGYLTPHSYRISPRLVQQRRLHTEGYRPKNQELPVHRLEKKERVVFEDQDHERFRVVGSESQEKNIVPPVQIFKDERTLIVDLKKKKTNTTTNP